MEGEENTADVVKVEQDTINSINNEFFKDNNNNLNKKLEEIFKITEFYTTQGERKEGTYNNFKNFFAIIKTTGIACANVDYSKNKDKITNIDDGGYILINLNTDNKGKAVQNLRNFLGRKEITDKGPKDIFFLSDNKTLYKGNERNEFNYYNINGRTTHQKSNKYPIFLTDDECKDDKKKKEYQEIITGKQDNLQEMLKSLLNVRGMKTGEERGYLNELFKNAVKKEVEKEKCKKIAFTIKYNETDKKFTIEKMEIEVQIPFNPKKHTASIGSNNLRDSLKQELCENGSGRKSLSKIKSEEMKNIIFNDEFRKFCIDNDIDGTKELLTDKQKEDFKNRLEEAEHNYPCDVDKKLIDVERLKKIHEDFSKQFCKEAGKFIKEADSNNVNKEEIEQNLKDKGKSFEDIDEVDLLNFIENYWIPKDMFYVDMLDLKNKAIKEIKISDIENIKPAFGFDKAVFNISVDRSEKGKKNKVIKKLFLSKSSVKKTKTEYPLHTNIHIMSAYQVALGNNQMKMYSQDTMESASKRGYTPGEELAPVFTEKITQLIKKGSENKLARSHNELKFSYTEGVTVKKTPFSTAARIRYFLTNPISDNHVNNFFYKIAEDAQGNLYVKEFIPFDYDKENKDKNANVKQDYQPEISLEILPWLGKIENDFNIKEEFDTFIKEVHKIITIDPKTMFDIIAYRLQSAKINVIENLDRIYHIMSSHILRLDSLLKLMQRVIESLNDYHKKQDYREYCEKLKYIYETMLPDAIKKWNEVLKSEKWADNKTLNLKKKQTEKEKSNKICAISIMNESFKDNIERLKRMKQDIDRYNNEKKSSQILKLKNNNNYYNNGDQKEIDNGPSLEGVEENNDRCRGCCPFSSQR